MTHLKEVVLMSEPLLKLEEAKMERTYISTYRLYI